MLSATVPLGHENIERQYIITPKKFLILHTLSMGIYTVWWVYKVWRFLIQRNDSNANAALRTVFEIVYFIPRCTQILRLAKSRGYRRTYSPTILYLLYFFFVLLSLTPPPLFLFCIMSGLFFVQPLMAFNYILSKSPELDVVIDRRFSVTETIIAVLGGIWWLLIVIGLLAMTLDEQH